ncbi:MAG: protein-glutamate O-methyltransferase CheR [Candidatus Eisenbacteria sp.]|nr:protein-glutamate O-methyltransferase CheR [Candidatus Eisenbacteria bacterium]
MTATQTLEFQALRDYVGKHCGLVINDAEAGDTDTRISQLMLEYDCADGASFYQLIRGNTRPEIRDRIIEVLTARETCWFRDAHPFVILKEKILPALAGPAHHNASSPIRIWSAGCSTGQEPYSIAIAMDEFYRSRTDTEPGRFEIIGTDISPSAIMLALAGRYDGVAMAQGLSEEIRREYFTEGSRTWEIKPEVRSRVSFRKHNLRDSTAEMGLFDIIFMRHVVRDYTREFREDFHSRLMGALHPSGYLILGTGESPEGCGGEMEVLSYADGEYYRRSN